MVFPEGSSRMGFLDLIGIKVITIEDKKIPLSEIHIHVNPLMGKAGTDALLNDLVAQSKPRGGK